MIQPERVKFLNAAGPRRKFDADGYVRNVEALAVGRS
jgi:hypothetical protein